MTSAFLTYMTTAAFSPVAAALVYLTTTTVHPSYFPYPLAPTLHAARVSIAYQANARKGTAVLSWGTYLAGFLIMVFRLCASGL